MELNKKMKALCKAKGLNKKELCEKMNYNYIVFLRNVKAGLLSSDLLSAINNTFPDVDLNWLYKEGAKYKEINLNVDPFELSDTAKLDKAIELLQSVKSNLSLK